MTGGTLAARYATALLDLAVEASAVPRFRTELDAFADIYRRSHDLRVVLHNPSIVLSERRALVRALSAKLNASPTLTHFLLLLVDRDRMSSVADIAGAFGELADDHQGIVRATVTSAFDMEPGQQTRMKELLDKLTGRNVVIQTQTDPALLGGVVTHIGGKVYDGSLRTHLANIQQAAQQR